MKIEENYQLKDELSFKIPTISKFYVSIENINDLKEICEFSKKSNIKMCILGGGANTIFNNSYFDGIVVSTKLLNKVDVTDNLICAESGVAIKTLNEIALSSSLSGLEFSGGLPGSVGGAVVMNAKAYNKDFASVVESVEVFDLFNFNLIILQQNGLNFSYKDSIFQYKSNYFILSVKFHLKYGNIEDIEKEYQKNISDREIKGQFDYPSAGCIFKNIYNIGISTGKIIDEVGLKGKSIGGASVFEKHANFIINKNSATSNDVISLIKFIEDEVYSAKAIKLEREIRII